MRGTSILLLFVVCMISYSTQRLTKKQKRELVIERFINRVRKHVTKWEKGTCVRPKTGACAEADTCCGEKRGRQQWTRKCKDAYPSCGYKLEKSRFRCIIDDCEEEEVNFCDSNPCQNGGKCSMGEDTNGLEVYLCDCSGTGFTGGDCEDEVTEVQTEECEDRPAGAQWKPVGCFQDGSFIPSFDKQVTVKGGASKMTVQKCKAKCMATSKKHYYYALRDGNKCFCGDCKWEPKYGGDLGDKCNKKCTGSNAKCGGIGMLKVFGVVKQG